MTDISSNIKKARLEAKMSQKALGEAVNVTPAAINYYEKNKNKPSIDVLADIARATGKPLFWFFMDESEQASYSRYREDSPALVQFAGQSAEDQVFALEILSMINKRKKK